jgi:exodeoxyribonuclease VII small subunit
MTTSHPNPEGKEPPISFELALRELQLIVSQLDGGQLSLTDSLGCFERGSGLLKFCHQELDQAERKIEILTGFNASGEPVTEPYDDEATLDQREKKAGRRKSTSKKGATKAKVEETPTDEPENEDEESPRLFF